MEAARLETGGGRFLTSHSLKLIAMAAMVVDHAGVIFRWSLSRGTYSMMRHIGRTAFPLFCFMLVEGFFHTRSRRGYLRNLLIFAVLSELPFRGMLRSAGYPDGCNVYWTLLLGLLSLTAAEGVSGWLRRRGAPAWAGFACGCLPAGALWALAEWMETDYGGSGVLLIFLIYCGEKWAPYGLRRLRDRQFAAALAAACAAALWMACYDLERGYPTELYGLTASGLILLYNGERGRYWLPKWCYYAFYPVHLVVLLLLRVLLRPAWMF